MSWEEEYAGTERMWSGRPNQVLIDVITQMTPGRSLDVGCGEGADVLWLASHGWRAWGIDLSATAIDRARHEAEAAGLANARFHTTDLLDWEGAVEGGYDLVTAFFIHTPEPTDRVRILRRAAELVAEGGRLLIVSHATMPPWARHHDDTRTTPDQDRSALDLVDGWAEELAETRSRPATGPESEQAVLEDNVLFLRRVP